MRLAVGGAGRFTVALAVVGAFGLVYLALTYAAGVPEAASLVGRLTRRVRGGQ
jgi:hypothetical protein